MHPSVRLITTGVLSHLLTRAIPIRMDTPSSAITAIACYWALLCAVSCAEAATVPSGFGDSKIASGIVNPTAMAFAPDGRLFLCEQGGRVRVVKDGVLRTDPFITFNVDSSGERGLLGIAFDPDFVTNSYVYLYYTTKTNPIHNRVVRVMASGDYAVAGSERLILQLNNLGTALYHNGGALHFGPDKKLYIAVGENTIADNSQLFTNLFGKMLRIASDGSIPTDNPFYATATGNNRAIWALGLRNPFTFAFEPGSGRMFINDVGNITWEEIDEGVGGGNYGWPQTEGPGNDPRFKNPLFYYGRGSGATLGCAITGGVFYRPAVAHFPNEFTGDYFFADYCSGWIRRLNPATGTATTFASGTAAVVDLDVGPDGSLYYLGRGDGGVHRISYSGSQTPQITVQPADVSVSVGQPSTFRVTASGSQPLSYKWRRNGLEIPGATASAYTLLSAVAADNNARFQVTVSNTHGSITSTTAVLLVTSNLPPVVQISLPALSTNYRGGSRVNYAGTATDPESGALSASAFSWKVDFHHDDHFHPFVPWTTGAVSGFFIPPTTGEVSANVWYRIHLKVHDLQGATTDVYRDILPLKSTFTLQTNPPGLRVTLDGTPYTTPLSVQGVAGIRRSLGVLSPQTAGTANHVFTSWSNNGAPSHTILTPSTKTTYTATFTTSGGSPPAAIYLSNLDPESIQNGWGPAEKDRSNGDLVGGDGVPLTLNGVVYNRGLGVHAAARLRFRVPAGCATFHSFVGVDDEVGSLGSVAFEVMVDAVSRFQSGTMTGSSATQEVAVDVAGKQYIDLIVSDGGDGIAYDHADWAEARLACQAQSGDVYLSSIAWTSAFSGWGDIEKDKSNGEMGPNDGTTLTLNGLTYQKGLGAHAPSQIQFNVPANCSTFLSDVGVDDEVDEKGSITFQVFADGTKLFDSGLMTGTTPTQQVSVPVAGRRELTLIVTPGTDGNWYDHADWANARLRCDGAASTSAPQVP
jgi:glucose/arabinose dehydrogenase